MATNVTSTIVLKVSGKEAENSFNGLNKVVRELERDLKKLEPGTAAFMKKASEVKEAKEHFSKVKNEIEAVNVKLKQSEGSFGKFRSKLADVGLGFTQIGVSLAAIQFGQQVQELLKISDAMADVQKTTGMAIEEVKGLWDAFDEMDTRTSKLDRLKIAEVGGRLGVDNAQMQSFVQEVDKAYVALGDSFKGGLEGVVESLGKMKNIFEETKGQSYADAINSIGSALNELAAAGTASEGNISDFTLRVGALPEALRPSIDKVLGLGAAFEESGIDSQVAASGYSNFMKVAGENLEAFAYSMNMSLSEARALFNEKPEEFFLRFSEGMKGIPAEQTAKIFDSLKIGTLEVQKAVGAAANNTDVFREAMLRSGVAMQEATSLNEEFNTKNNNAAAVWEKLKNAVSDFFSQTTFINFFEGAILIIGQLTGVVSDAGNGIKIFKDRLVAFAKIIAVATTAMVGYRLALGLVALFTKNAVQQTILYNVATKAKAAIDTVAKGATLLYASAKALFTGNTVKATVAMRAFNIATKANPIGLLVGAIMAAVTAYSLFKSKTEEAGQSQRKLNDVMKEGAEAAGKEVSQLDKLYRAAMDASKGKDAQRQALEKLQKIYPQYFGNLTTEEIKTGKLTSEYQKLRGAIIAAAQARAIEQEIEKIASEDLKERMENYENRNKINRQIKGYKATNNIVGAESAGTQIAELEAQRTKLEEKHKKGIIERNKRIEALLDMQEKLKPKADTVQNRDAGEISTEKTKGSSKTTTAKNRPASDNSIKDAKSAADKSREELEKVYKSQLDAQRKYWDERMQIEKESIETEKAQEVENYKRKREDLERENKGHLAQITKNKEEISTLEKAKKQAKNPEAISNYNTAIENLKQTNAEIMKLTQDNEKIMEQMRETHLFNIQKIESKYKEKAYQLFVETQQKEIEEAQRKAEEEIQQITSLEEAKLKISQMTYLRLTEEELRSIKNLEDAKKALREEASRKVLAEQLEAVKKQKEELEKLLSDESFSEEALEKLKQDLSEVDKAITKIKGTIQGNEEGDQAKQDGENRKQKESVDILGFSVAQWEDMLDNLDSTEGKIKGLIMTTQALANAFRSFSKLQQTLGDRELKKFTQNQDKKRKALLGQLNEGLISQEEYHKGIQQIEEETANKKKEIQQRAAKAEKAANLMSAIAGTATAVVNALKSAPPPANFALAGIVGALGAVQIATIAAQPVPEFAQGGYTGMGQGSPDRTGFRPVGIVHEQEYVTPKWMLENPVVADVVGWMENIRTGRTQVPKGYAEGGATTDTPLSITQARENSTAQQQINADLIPVLTEIKTLLSDLKEKGVEAWMVENAQNGKSIKRAIKKFEQIENRNARK